MRAFFAELVIPTGKPGRERLWARRILWTGLTAIALFTHSSARWFAVIALYLWLLDRDGAEHG